MAEIRPYSEADADAVSACLTEGAALDPTLRPCPIDEWRAFVAASWNNGGRDFMIADADGRIVGVLMSTRYSADGRTIRNVRVIVHPEFRQRGIGGALADVVETQDPDEDVTIRSCCLGSWHVGRAMLETRGFHITREELTMRRALGAVDPVTVDGISVRDATPGDDGDWIRLNAEGYADGPNYTPLEEEDVAGFRSDDGFRLFLAEDGDQVVGLCHIVSFGGGELWINSVVVSPSHRGRRIGRLLMTHALEALTKDGVEAVHLCVRAENAPAVSLYRSLGFTVDETDTIWWKG